MWMHHAAMVACGILATHVLHSVSLRCRWDRLPLGRLVPVVMLACLILSLVLSGILNGGRHLVTGPGVGVKIGSQGMLMDLFATSIVSFFLLGMWSALYYACQAFTRLHQIEVTTLRYDAAIKEARLHTIATQLNPHFLFNSLNTVRALIEDSPQAARDAVTQLSLVLRASLSTSDHKLIPLRDELTAVNALLDLEIARYGDRLHTERQVSEGCEKALVPPLLMVTLVENAVKHGVAARLGPGFLRYEISMTPSGLRLMVLNSGTLTEDWQNKGGIGLAHTRERLALLFGDRATMTIRQTDPGVEAVITLPPSP